VLLAALSAAADVIRLKNGRTIWADQVREKKDRVEYDVGEDSYAIPKSSVDRIDSGGIAPQHTGSTGSHHVPDFTPATPSFSHEADVTEKVIRDSKVDVDALSALEREAKPELALLRQLPSPQHEADHGNLPQAKHFLETALRFQPDNSTLLTYYAACLFRTGHAPEAVSYAERAVRADPDSPDALTMLGFVQFASDHTADAIRAWKKSLKLRPDATISQYLARGTRIEAPSQTSRNARAATSATSTSKANRHPRAFGRDLLATRS
jgi:hypothetical protein